MRTYNPNSVRCSLCDRKLFPFGNSLLGCFIGCTFRDAIAIRKTNLGEDWAEKVASELCKLLGLPHAIYELASTWEDSRGVISGCKTSPAIVLSLFFHKFSTLSTQEPHFFKENSLYQQLTNIK
jgi:hypothetical protein